MEKNEKVGLTDLDSLYPSKMQKIDFFYNKDCINCFILNDKRYKKLDNQKYKGAIVSKEHFEKYHKIKKEKKYICSLTIPNEYIEYLKKLNLKKHKTSE